MISRKFFNSARSAGFIIGNSNDYFSRFGNVPHVNKNPSTTYLDNLDLPDSSIH